MADKVDWNAVRLAYVTSNLSLRDIAAEFALHKSRVQRRYENECWKEQRERYGQNLLRETVQQTVKTRAEELREWNATDIEIAKLLRAKLERRLARIPDDPADFTDSLDTLRSIATTAEKLQRVVHLALGAPTANTGFGQMDGTPVDGPTLGDFYETVQFVDPEPELIEHAPISPAQL